MEEKKVTLFGTNLEKIPCFKKSLLTGMYAGLAAGLGHFIFTSKVKRSTDVAVYSFVATTLGFCAVILIRV